MDVVDNLRKPLLPKQLCDEPGLPEIQHKPVTVVVMSGVVMIELGWFFPLEGRRKGFPIPVRDNIHSIGIGRRYQDQNRVLKDLTSFAVLGGGKLKCQLHRHLRSDNLAGMDRTRDGHDRLAGIKEFVSFKVRLDQPRVRKFLLDRFILFQIAYILWRTNESDEKIPTKRCLSKSFNMNSCTGLIKTVKVVCNLFPVSNRSVVAWLKAKHVLR